MRPLITTAGAVVAITLLAACAASATTTTDSTAGPGTTAASAPAASCRSLYEAWKHGPAQTAGKALVAQLRAVSAAGTAADIPRLQAALKHAGNAAARTASQPMPHCADPHGYWPAILTRIRSAADNAGSGSGLGALMLAIVPLKEVPALESKLGAELRQTVHVGTPLT